MSEAVFMPFSCTFCRMIESQAMIPSWPFSFPQALPFFTPYLQTTEPLLYLSKVGKQISPHVYLFMRAFSEQMHPLAPRGKRYGKKEWTLTCVFLLFFLARAIIFQARKTIMTPAKRLEEGFHPCLYKRKDWRLEFTSLFFSISLPL